MKIEASFPRVWSSAILFALLATSLDACSTPRPYTGGDAGIDVAMSPGGSGPGGSASSAGGSSGRAGTGATLGTSTGGMTQMPSGSGGTTGSTVSTGGVAGAAAPGGATVPGSGGVGTSANSGGTTGIGGQSGTTTGGAGAAAGGTVGSGGVSGTGGASCQPKPRDCTSSLDNDCNGTADNQENAHCKCKAGTAQACGSPQVGIGICKAGSQSCELSSDKTTSDWAACTGAITSKARDCTSSADNDCNGTADSQETSYCKCTVGMTEPCQGNSTSPAVGICKYGTQSCIASSDKSTSSWSTSCVGSVGPKTRDCASITDNDCNGTPDNQDCYGTTVIAGTVTCGGGPGKRQCSTVGGCGWTPRVDNPAGSCGNPGSGNYWMTCDGPNDCSGGVCCAHFNGFFSGGVTCFAGNQSGIGGCPPDDTEFYSLVCDPLNDKCPAGYHCVPHPNDPTNYWADCTAN